MAVRILTGAQVEKSAFQMPNDEQLRELLRAVLVRYRVLDSSKARDWTDRDGVERERAFKNCFWALAYFTRLESVEKKRAHATTFWCGEVDDFLHASDVWDFEIGQAVFTLALIAHNDIAFTPLTPSASPAAALFALPLSPSCARRARSAYPASTMHARPKRDARPGRGEFCCGSDASSGGPHAPRIALASLSAMN